MDTFLIVVGALMSLYAGLNIFYYQAQVRNAERIEAKVIGNDNNDALLSEGRLWCNPKVLVKDGNQNHVFYVSSDVRSGHNAYKKGEIITLIKYRTLFGKTIYAKNRGLMTMNILILVIGLGLILGNIL